MAKTTYDIDATKAVRSLKDLENQLDKIEDAADDSGKKLTKAEKAAQSLAKQADPTKRHAAEYEKLAKAVKGGKLELKDAAVLADRYDAKLARAGQSSKGAFGPLALAQIGGMVGGFTSLSAAAALYTKELDAQQNLFDKRVATQLTVDQSRAVVRRNLSGSSDAEIKDVASTAIQIADKTGISEVFINQALADSLSASGVNIPASKKAVRAAARISPDTPEDIKQIAGTLLDLSKVTKTNDGLANLGYLSAVGAAGRVVDAKAQATNIAPGIIGTLPFGGNAKDSGSLFAALSNAGADSQGQLTGTAIIQFARQIEAFDKKTAAFDSDTLGGRVSALQGNQKLAEAFLSKASFAGKAVGPIRQLLTDAKSNAALQYAANLKDLPELEGLSARGQRAIDVLSIANPLQVTAQRGRTLSRFAEGLQAQRASDQLSTAEIDNVKVILQELGGTALGTDAGLFLSRLDGDGITTSEVQGSLRSRAKGLRRSHIVRDGFDDPTSTLVPASREDIATANTLGLLADKLDTLIGVTERSAAAAEQSAAAINEAPINPQQE